ncbi:MAG TPA: hypothetical protein VMV25_06485 [Steroidobacteraceae bacterium]|nr:hypothetical protein [Steroidobacteraceae bacterium]
MPDAAVSRWSRGSPISPPIMRSLRQLNCGFLDLQAFAAGRFGGLSTAQKEAIANCPYALFDLRFHDDGYWQRRLQSAQAWQVADTPPADPQIAAFAQLALFYAWHVAATARLSARLLLGMHEATAATLGGITLDRLPALALSEAVHLSARWSHCDAYWQALANAAARADRVRLRRVQLYGLQLAAAAHLPWP